MTMMMSRSWGTIIEGITVLMTNGHGSPGTTTLTSMTAPRMMIGKATSPTTDTMMSTTTGTMTDGMTVLTIMMRGHLIVMMKGHGSPGTITLTSMTAPRRMTGEATNPITGTMMSMKAHIRNTPTTQRHPRRHLPSWHVQNSWRSCVRTIAP